MTPAVISIVGDKTANHSIAHILDALTARRSAAERVIRDRIAAGRAAGEFARDTDVDTLAAMMVTTLYGLSIKARDGASRASLRKVVEQVMRMWPRAKAERR